MSDYGLCWCVTDGHYHNTTGELRSHGKTATIGAMMAGAVRAEYEICQRRGHQSDGGYTQGWESWWICKWCGTHYRTEESLVEKNTPEEAADE